MGSKTRKAAIWLLALTTLTTLLIAVAVHLFEWNMLRGMIGQRVSQSIGRPFAINGDVQVHWSAQPTITADRLSFGNAPWSKTPTMAQLDRLTIRVNPRALLHCQLELPSVVLSHLDLLLEKNAAGAKNWALGSPSATQKAGPLPLPEWLKLGLVNIEEGSVRYVDPTESTDITAHVATRHGIEGRDAVMAVDASGRYRNMGLHVAGSGGALLALRDAKLPYPIDLKGEIAETRFSAKGTVTDLNQLAGLDLDFSLSGHNLAQLYPILKLPFPPSAPYQVAGSLQHENKRWAFHDFSGKVGRSDMAGYFSVDLAQKPKYIQADLTSKQLDLKDLSGFIGARQESGAPIQLAGDRILPQREFDFGKLSSANADVRLRGLSILNASATWPLDDLVANLRLRDGRLQLDPLNVGVAGGQFISRLQMDSTTNPIKSQLTISASKLRLERLLPALGKNKKVNAGVVGGQAKLVTYGNSIAKMLASADGNLSVIMNGGEISKLLLRLSNLDIANLIPILLAGDKPVPIRCLVADMHMSNGNAKVRTLILDTDKQVIVGDGNIDFRGERLNLVLKVHPKDNSLVALRGPILVTGSFKQPEVKPQLGQATGRTVLAVALGLVAPPLALLPLVEFGGAPDTPCRQLIKRADTHAQGTR
ncbi:AsmA family protein [Andreprevotia chitinilytica]|uniref:AsmA family protein n=1 Tax=Andreprevotia chitinilytica TaxID=396808 RepID=UPI0005579F67|nr:AsmA family protein [Andreprevotia chitinilytica]